MSPSLRRLGLPAYLLLCLVAGGSAQGVWGNFALQLLAVAMLAALALSKDRGGQPQPLGGLPRLGLALLALVLVQLIPLPPGLWAALPGRAFVASGFDLLHVPRPWMAWSLAPAASIATLLPLLIPVAVLAAVVRRRADRPYFLIAAMMLGTLLGILLGFLQLRGGGAAWYLYRYSAFGQAPGFFANSNHMGSLLLVNIPFLVALAADLFERRKDLSQRGLVLGAAIGFAFVLLIAIAVNHSLAVLLLGGPVVLLSLAIPAWRRPGIRKGLALVAVAALAIAVAVGAAQGKFATASQDSSIQTRSAIWATSLDAIADFRLTGSGLGTFERVQRHYDDPDTVDTTYTNHAHNDYLEVAVELGLPGLILVAFFLLWWARRAASAWRPAEGNVYARAASIASAALLVHSLVDFPLRTAAISALFAMCLGLLAIRMAPAPDEKRKPLWSPRHVRIG
ncbi:MAG: O-antigen ligase family protein [Sphingomicrobium sp.]